jgi:hypothetical protein
VSEANARSERGREATSATDGPIARVRFLGRRGVLAMEDRARGLAAHLPPHFTSSYDFRDGPGLIGSWRAFWRAVGAARTHDALWLLSQHPSRVLGAALGRLLFRTPFAVDTGDLLAESERTRGKSGAWCAFVGWWERLSLKLPSAVVVRGSAHVPIARDAGARRVELIPDGVEVAAFARQDTLALRRQLGVEGATTIGVIATISVDAATGLPSPGWDVVECVARLSDMDVAGIIVGDGPGMPALRALAERRGVASRMRYAGRVQPGELPAWMSAIDVFLHTALNNPMSQVRTTGKLPLLLAAGSAAVVSRVGEAARVLEGTGLLLDFDGPAGDYAARLAARVREIIAKGELERWRDTGPAIARREFEYATLGQRAGALLDAMRVSRGS